jgi:hypothetical protein
LYNRYCRIFYYHLINLKNPSNQKLESQNHDNFGQQFNIESTTQKEQIWGFGGNSLFVKRRLDIRAK